MSSAAPSAPPLPRLSAGRIFAVVLLAGTGLGLTWLLRAERAENAALRGELATLMLAQRAAASRESLAADAIRRAARLDEALHLMRREATPAPPDAGRAVELERVIAFLREEVNAAHETIERLKHDDPPRGTESR
jgi:hypothetical protein